MQSLVTALQFDGLWLLVGAVVLAGIVRGFSGFGTAMVFVPLAALVVSPIHTIIMMMSFDLLGPVLLLPRAVREGELRDVSILGVGAIFGLPVGIFFLTRIEPEVFRWLVSILAIALLVLMASGWRYRNRLSTLATGVVGVISGFLSGVVALAGPPVILSYMSSPRSPKMVRANIMMYLFLLDILALIMFGLHGLLELQPLLVGVLLAVPYGIGGLIGQRIFDPSKEKTYRRVAYVLIAASAIAGLPIISG